MTLVLRPDSHLQMGKLVEVVGKVMDLEGGQVCPFIILYTLDVGCGVVEADLVYRVLVFVCLGRWIGGIRRIVVFSDF